MTTVAVEARGVVTPERFARGMTIAQYLDFIGTPENLAREAGWWLGPQRHDFSGPLRARYERARLSEAQTAAIRWLAAQPHGPARILVISEEWSSDCRRDMPMLARLAEAGGLELRIFTRDGQTVGREPRANPADSPNADPWPRFIRDWGALQQSPFWWMWASAGIDEILSALHERQLVKETTHGDA